MQKSFIDTNIFVYWLNQEDRTKNQVATKLIGTLSSNNTGVCTMQVVREFTNVAMKKFREKVGPVELDDLYDGLFEPLIADYTESLELFGNATYLMRRYSLQFYDALIIQSAITLGCDRIYSEDLQHGQVIEGVEIVNPFINC